MYSPLPPIEILKDEYSDTVFQRLWNDIWERVVNKEDTSGRASFTKDIIIKCGGHISSRTRELNYDPNEVAQCIIDNARLYPYTLTENDFEWWSMNWKRTTI